MTEQFFAELAAGPSPLADLRVDQGENPFRTDPYVHAMRELGYECWILGTRANGAVSDAAVATVKRGRLGAELEIPSLPRAAQTAIFWDGVYALSKQLRVTDMVAETFGSPSLAVPNLRGETNRKDRNEYVIPLESGDFEARFCTNHSRNIKKARMAGLTLRHCSINPESMLEHASMIRHSMARRVARGEEVLEDPEANDKWAYLRSGAGELVQAVHEGKVVSSMLLLRSLRTAYNESTGTSPEGMRVGSSSFLIHEVCRKLVCEGAKTFNLGGAPEHSSLARFKAGFGATEVHLCACTSYLGPRWLKYARSIAGFARRERAAPLFSRPEPRNKLVVST